MILHPVAPTSQHGWYSGVIDHWFPLVLRSERVLGLVPLCRATPAMTGTPRATAPWLCPARRARITWEFSRGKLLTRTGASKHLIFLGWTLRLNQYPDDKLRMRGGSPPGRPSGIGALWRFHLIFTGLLMTVTIGPTRIPVLPVLES